ncbi:hypothetical protein FP803_04125 [Candidatus Woesearchaeota archaeon]|nr:hypothetical protein [Candidatus Woesearchaeota archaeon]MBU3942043.1 hypothetical protein [Nanoarchaeota archaeon]
MTKKIKEKHSLDSLILSGDKIKKINLYLKEHLTAEIKLKYSSVIFNYINIKREELDSILNFYDKFRKAILDENSEIEISRKEDALVSMILKGYEIDNLKTSDVRLDSVAVIHFNGKSPLIYRHMTPTDLGKYMLDYWRFQRMNNDADEWINTILVNKGPKEELFQNYKEEVIKSFLTFLGLPNNYNNKNTPTRIKINPTIIEIQA